MTMGRQSASTIATAALPRRGAETAVLRRTGRLAVRQRILAASLLTLMAVVCLLVVRNESVTFDERAHIPAGLSYLQQHDGRLNIEHPPLIKMLAALPLAIRGTALPYDADSWAAHQDFVFGDTSIRSWRNRAPQNIFLARVPMILLTLLLGAQIFVMARHLGGFSGGILALLVFTTSPFFLAYGPLVLTDIGVAFFALQTVWAFASLWQSPTPGRSLLTAASLTGALLSKYSSGLIIPICVMLAVIYASRSPNAAHARRAALLSVCTLMTAAALVYLFCAFAYWNTDTVALLRFKYAKRPVEVVRVVADLLEAHPWLKAISFPTVLYSLGVGSTLRGLSRATYLMGHIYERGTWTYFPVLFGYKMTPGFLGLILLLLCLFVWRRLNAGSKLDGNQNTDYHALALAALFFIFGISTILSPLNIGIRHISVPIAALTALIGLVPPMVAAVSHERARMALGGIVVVAALGCVCSAALTYPHYLSYFNSLTGAKQKFEIAVDSNLDWGQTLIPLRDFMAAHSVDSIHLDSSGSLPDVYVPGAQPFDCENGVPAHAEWLAVGASRFFSEPDLSFDAEKPVGHCLGLFRYESWSEAGGALYIFHVTRAGDVSPANDGSARLE